MTKILFITHTFPFPSGEQFIETEIKYLAESDNEIILLPLKATGERRNIPRAVKLDMSLAQSNIVSLRKLKRLVLSKYLYTEILFKPKVLFSPIKLKKTIQLIYAAEGIASDLSHYVRSSKDRDVLVYSYWANQGALAGAILKRKFPAIKGITRCHRYDLYKVRNIRDFMPMEKQYLNDLDAVFPCSSDGAEYLISEYKVDSNKVIVARLGTVDYGYGAGFNEDKSYHIVSCSYLVPVKRVNLIIEALALLQLDINITWTHIGDGSELNKVKNMAAAKLNKVNVCWKGNISNDDVTQFYKTNKVDCFINVSSSEGIPVSIMEASSFGIPIVALDVGGVREIVSEKNGVLLKSNATISDIALAIKYTVQRNTLTFRKEVKNTWFELYCAKRNYNQFVSLLARL